MNKKNTSDKEIQSISFNSVKIARIKKKCYLCCLDFDLFKFEK